LDLLSYGSAECSVACSAGLGMILPRNFGHEVGNDGYSQGST
jgi:hypothetical protein